jgi:hypothetical protein
MKQAIGALGCALALALTGCGEKKGGFDGPTVDKFNGKVVQNGKAVSFAATETAELKLILQAKPESFGVPIKSDGTFQIGWMPIGKYSAQLIRVRAEGGKKSAPMVYNVPNGLTIAEGQTEYAVELGPDYKP